MALKVDYVLKETGANLFRNISLTIASVLTVAVSLSLVGASLMIREGVDNATKRWEGGIEFIVFLQPDATQEQINSVGAALEENPQVGTLTFVDKQATFEEFKDLFSGTPQLVDNVSPDILPPSYRVVPEAKQARSIAALGQQFEDRPGVRQVVFAFETVQQIETISGYIGWILVAVALALLLAATLLILNTIRMAMFARRREIEVMKLVGASNWFVRVPFMLEGVVAGVLGSMFAVVVVWVINSLFDGVAASQDFAIFAGFAVDSGTTWLICAGIVGLGIFIGSVGSAFAVSRYLDV